MRPSKIALVVTTIQAPNTVMRELAAAARTAGAGFYVLGDRKSPPVWELEGAEYYGLEAQHARFGDFSRLLPAGHYVRKNLGYIAALQAGAEWIVETDDDNHPLPHFLAVPAPVEARGVATARDWVNVYSHFGASAPVWPRGLPLEEIAQGDARPDGTRRIEPRIVQGLADDNPDVDAVFRLTRPLPVTFDRAAAPLALARGQWCPFNSQATWFRRDVAALLYLPAFCSFRMTDIWRSFVAQRCLWELGSELLFTSPTVVQERNEHNLLRDFADEVPGYLKNGEIRRVLADCTLTGEPAADLVRCYEALAARDILPVRELELVHAWVAQVQAAGR